MASKPIYRTSLFSKESLAGELLAVDNAIYELQPLATTQPGRVLKDIIDFEPAYANVLLLVLSREKCLRDHIVHSFPTSTTSGFLGSIHSIILHLLAREVEDPASTGNGSSPPELQTLVNAGDRALQDLHAQSGGKGNDLVGPKAFRREGKGAAPAASHLLTFGIKTEEDWSTPAGLENCTRLILKRLKSVSEVLLAWIPSWESTYTTQIVQGSDSAKPHAVTSAALYPENLVGFGLWRIVVGKKAETTLRQLSKRDPVTFNILWERLRTLSHGYLSSSRGHAKPAVAKSQYGIPVLQDKVTRDLRIIYHVDCFPTDNVSKQGLKIIDVCTLAQMDGRLKTALHGLFKATSEEYKKRCTPHLLAGPPGQQVYLPQSYPDLPEQDMFVQNLLDIGAADDNESRFSVERYTPLSQTLLDSLLSGTELTLPHLISPQERTIIEHPLSCYVLGRSGTGKTTVMVSKMLLIEREHEMRPSTSHPPRQLMVTQSPMLAEKISLYYRQLYTSLPNIQLQEAGGLTDRMAELPEKLTELGDIHFPVITTVSKVWAMIEAAIGIKRSNASRDLVYDLFLSEYWSHFPQNLTDRLDPVMVYAEFLGVIKGSEKTLQSGSKALSREEYLGLSFRAYPTFSMQRDVVYDLFDLYSRQQRASGDRDATDRTHSVISLLYEQGGTLPGIPIDFLYVDEVQDNLLIDTLVLRALCQNPNGLFWAGDTAQTIAMGSSFRFNDLKAFQFRYEENRQLKSRLSLPAAERPPIMFQLAINYRSHAGIVNCARSVVELIERFWPESIDSLAPEHGRVSGAQPIFFGKDSGGAFSLKVDESLSGSEAVPMDLGAEQCIIVRDEKAKARVQKSIGKIGLIMTIYEAKGQEFNDVILLDIFSDSEPDEARWRLVLQALETGDNHAVTAPQYDSIKHANICVELKLLYVAITRARESLWIVDSSERAVPIEMFWRSKKLVRSWTGQDPLPNFARSSAADEWKERGESLFNQGQFEHAEFCFERANVQDRAIQAKACRLRIVATRLPPSRARDSGFLEAGSVFIKCAKMSCGNVILARYSDAAQCLQDGSDFRGAVRSFVLAEKFSHAVSLAAEIKLYEKAMSLIRQHEARIDIDLINQVTLDAKVYYAEDFEGHKRLGGILFESQAEEISFLKDHSISICAARLVNLNRRVDAGMLYIQVGQFADGIELLSGDPRDAVAMREACQCLIAALWQSVSFGMQDVNTAGLKSILQLKGKLNEYDIPIQDKRQISLFQAISSGSPLTWTAYSRNDDNQCDDAIALLRLDVHFAHLRRGDLTDTLRLLEAYTKVANSLRDSADFLSKKILRLFGVRKSTVYPNRLLVGKHTMTNNSPTDKDNMDIQRVQTSIKHYLQTALVRRIEAVLDSAILNPHPHSVMAYVSITSDCGNSECNAVHISPLPSAPSKYLSRVSEQLHRAIGIDILGSIDENAMQRRKWLLFPQLYRTVFPVFYSAGSSFYIRAKFFDKVEHMGLAVVSRWCNELGTGTLLIPGMLTLCQTLRLAIMAIQVNDAESLPTTKVLVEPQDDVHNALLALRGIEPCAVSAGLSFARALVSEESYHFLDISVLCDYMEILCTQIVMANSFKQWGSLHKVTIPRTWTRFCSYWSKEALASQDVPVPLLCICLVKIFEFVMIADDDRLRYNDTELNEQTLLPEEADIFRIRACLWIAVVALNIKDSREMLHVGLSSIYDQLDMALTDVCGDLPWSFYEGFTKDMESLLYTSRSILSKIQCSMEDFVEVIDPLLLEESLPEPIKHIKRIFCSDRDTLRRLVQRPSSGSSVPGALKIGPIRPIFYTDRKGLDLLLKNRGRTSLRRPVIFEERKREQLQDTATAGDVTAQLQGEGVHPQTPATDISIDQGITETIISNLSPSNADRLTLHAVETDTGGSDLQEKQDEDSPRLDSFERATDLDNLANAISRALYRRRVNNQRDSSARHAALMDLFCSWESRVAGRQRIVMLGPGLHIIRFLSVAANAAKGYMARTRKHLKTAEDYNAAYAEDSNARSAYKVWSRISSEFNKAGVNERGETEELSKIVQRIQEAMENSFPFSVPDEDMLDFEIGTKGIRT